VSGPTPPRSPHPPPETQTRRRHRSEDRRAVKHDVHEAAQRILDHRDCDFREHTRHAHAQRIGDHHAFLLGYRSADVDLRPPHPLPSQIPYIWQVFQENVDPLVKILHIPTMNKLIREIRTDLDNLTPSTEALMFSIYYSAITSLEDEDVSRTPLPIP